MKKIVIDGHSLKSKKRSGFEVFADALLPALSKKSKRIYISVLGRGTLARILNFSSLFRRGTLRIVYPTNPPLIWWPSLLRKATFICHDVGPIVHPDCVQWLTRLVYKRFLQACLKNGHVVAVSEFTAHEIERLYGIRPDVIGNICRTLPGASEIGDLLPASFLSSGYSLAVGTIEPRKRYDLLVSAFQEYRRIYANDAKLVIVGRLGWANAQMTHQLEQAVQAGWLVWMQSTPDEALCGLYKNCNCLLSTSVYEGFNMPVFEALSFGRAVLVRAQTAPTWEDVEVSVFHEDSNCAVAEAINNAINIKKKSSVPTKYTAENVAERLLNFCEKQPRLLSALT